jgi:hypothetical protein
MDRNYLLERIELGGEEGAQPPPVELPDEELVCIAGGTKCVPAPPRPMHTPALALSLARRLPGGPAGRSAANDVEPRHRGCQHAKIEAG